MRRSACLVLLALVCAGCGHEADDRAGERGDEPVASSSPSIRTLTPLPQPPLPPATGKLFADMRQSSRDAARARMEVWVDNDTLDDLTPTSVSYHDPRFLQPEPGTRLRVVPTRSERGFPIYLPEQPDCAEAGKHREGGQVDVTYGRGGDPTSVTLDVSDETDVVGRYVSARCDELAVEEVATLAWADTVTDGPPAEVAPGSTATLTLVVRPTGVAGRSLRIDTVATTPVLAAVGQPFWKVDRTIAGDDPVTRIPLELKPNRCDPHAFLESGGATAFRVKMHLDGRPIQLILRMSEKGAAHAIAYAGASCGFAS